MIYNHYLSQCRQLLQAFEQTQSIMLRLDFVNAYKEFTIEISEFNNLLEEMKIVLTERKFADNRQQYLYIKQIQRLQTFLKEMQGLIKNLTAQPEYEIKKIIFIFDRQHLFKNILRKHISDFVKISN
jgi:hypothetical protein